MPYAAQPNAAYFRLHDRETLVRQGVNTYSEYIVRQLRSGMSHGQVVNLVKQGGSLVDDLVVDEIIKRSVRTIRSLWREL